MICRGGGIGRRDGLKIHYPQGCESSNLSRGTRMELSGCEPTAEWAARSATHNSVSEKPLSSVFGVSILPSSDLETTLFSTYNSNIQLSLNLFPFVKQLDTSHLYAQGTIDFWI